MKGKIFWGLFLILMAVYIVVSQLGLWNPVGVWPMVLTVLCLAMFVHGIAEFSFFGMLLPLSIICILYRPQLGIERIGAWSLIAVAVLGSIGLELLFGKAKKKFKKNKRMDKSESRFADHTAQVNESEFDVESKFGSDVRYVRTDNFCYATVDTKFSGTKLYFQEAKIPQGNATLEINMQFSGLEIYVPANWTVINHVDASFGGVEEKGAREAGDVATLTLQGNIAFAGITVKYV